MICILEPKSDQALSGSFLYNRELAAASYGKIERLTLESEEIDRQGQEDIVLIDSAWLFAPEARILAKSASNGFLVHSLPEEKKDWVDVLGACAVLVASSRSIARRLEQALPEQRIIVCEAGVDTRIRSLQPQPREHDLLRLITVSNIMPRKGFKEAIDFLQGLERLGLAWHWYIVGEPAPDRDFNGHKDIDEAYFDDLLASLNELAWEDDVSFVGPMAMEQQLRLYVNMDVVFFPSREEYFGLSLLEAGQLGLPVLTTDVGIASELFRNDGEALVLPAPLSVNSLAFAHDFLKKYVGREKNVRIKREHPLLARSWGKAADELIRALRPVN